MTPAQQKAQLRRVIRNWMTRLNLDHWHIDIHWDDPPEDEDALASITIDDYYDHAFLRFRDDWYAWDIELLNRVVVHELLHVHIHPLGRATRSITITGCLGSDARILWFDRCNDAEEAVVDRLARCFVGTGGVVE